MTKETIRRIDVFAGNILCFLLTLHRRLGALLSGKRRASPIRSILFLKLIEQGATVLAVPAIRKAVARVGRENVYFCVFKENRAILDLLGLVPPENVIEIRHDRLPTFLADSLRALRRIRRLGIDCVIDMEFMARAPAVFSYLTGASHRVGLHRFTAEGPYRGDLMTHRVHYNPYLHTAQAYALLVDALDEDPSDQPLLKIPIPPGNLERPRFAATPADVARVRQILADCGASTGPLVLLNPNTGDLLPLRMWPTARVVELGRRILAEYPEVTVVVTGGPGEQQGAEEVARAMESGRAVSVAGRTTLRDLFTLYTLADVLVTNDSGPGHFASMTDIHNIVLFGPETPQLFGPLGGNGLAIWANLACSPCINPYNNRFSPCTDNRCMQAISTEQVFREVASRLGSQAEAVRAIRR